MLAKLAKSIIRSTLQLALRPTKSDQKIVQVPKGEEAIIESKEKVELMEDKF